MRTTSSVGSYVTPTLLPLLLIDPVHVVIVIIFIITVIIIIMVGLIDNVVP